MMTVVLHTVIDTAASTPPEEIHMGKSGIRNLDGETRARAPKIASQTPGLTITNTAWATDDSVVAIDMEKMKNKRKRKAGTLTPLETWINS